MTAAKSELFYDPFAERSEKLEGIDLKFSTEQNNGGVMASSGSANEDESPNEDEQVR